MRWRGAEITGTEIALYWLGFSFVVTFAMGPMVLSWFGQLAEGELIASWLAGVLITVASGLALVYWRRAEITGTEIALYWLGLSLAVAFAMGPLVTVLEWNTTAISTNMGGFTAGWIAGEIFLVVSTLAWVRWRGADIIRQGLALYSLALPLILPIAAIEKDLFPFMVLYLLLGTMVAFVWTLAWVLRRRERIIRAEICLCWLGLSLPSFLPIIILSVAPALEPRTVEVALIFVSPLAWALWRRVEIIRTEVAFYWPGLSIAVTFPMAVCAFMQSDQRFDHIPEDFSRSWFYGAVIAAIIGMILLSLWRWRS
jgi:hypothetical protein